MALAKQLRRKQIRGTFVTADGKPESDDVDEQSLLELVTETDLVEAINVELPAALAAARRGDPAPLLRLNAAFYRTGRPDDEDYEDGLADGAYIAALCGDLTFGAGMSPRKRRTELKRRLAALPAERFGPFSRNAAYKVSPGYMCSTWPYTPRVPDRYAKPRRIPTLVISGLADIRTPPAQARAIARQIPGAQLIEVGGSGHGPTYYEECAAEAVGFFLRGERLANCVDETLTASRLARSRPSSWAARMRRSGR